MSDLPPVARGDVPTKRDVDTFESRLDDKIDAFAARTEAMIERSLHEQTKTLIFSLAGVMVTLTAITIAALRLT